MNKKIKKTFLITIIIVLLFIILQLILNIKLKKNTYNDHIKIKSLADNRIAYIERLFSKIEEKNYNGIYKNLSETGREVFNNDIKKLETYIEDKILLSEEIDNSYLVDIDDISERGNNVIIIFKVIITPSDIDLAKELLKKNRVVRSMYVEVEEIGPNDYKVNKIFEKDEE